MIIFINIHTLILLNKQHCTLTARSFCDENETHGRSMSINNFTVSMWCAFAYPAYPNTHGVANADHISDIERLWQNRKSRQVRIIDPFVDILI